MREMNGVAQLISSAVQASGVDDTISKQLTETLQKELNDYISLESLKNKLEVLYSFEKNYL
ncbi:nickel transporter, partial [Klebsiella pneumoniae subsp. pneumoniae]